jgi:hypothetical protein
MLLLICYFVFVIPIFYLTGATFFKQESDMFKQFFIGVLINMLAINIIQIFVPISFNYHLIIIFPLLIYNKDTLKLKYNFIKSKIDINVILLILIILFLSSQIVTLGDTYLYHSQNIQWFNKFKLIKGLANLNYRYAFNSWIFPLQSSFLFAGKLIFFPLNGILLFVLLLKMYYDYKKNKNLALLFIIFFIIFKYRFIVSSTSTDLTVFIFYFFLIYSVDENLLSNRTWSDIKYIILYSLLFLCIKLSAFILILPFIFIILYKNKDEIIKNVKIKDIIIGSFIISIWAYRNIITSGYLLFPSNNIFRFATDWSIPIHFNNFEIENIYDGSLFPGQNNRLGLKNLNFMDRWGMWLKIYSERKDFIVLMVTTSIAIILSFTKLLNRVIKIYILTFLAIIIFWFITAPDYRFIYAILVLLIYFISKNRIKSSIYDNIFKIIFLSSMIYQSTKDWESFPFLLPMGTQISIYNPKNIKSKKIFISEKRYVIIADSTMVVDNVDDRFFPSTNYVYQIDSLYLLNNKWENGIYRKLDKK